MYDSYEVCRDVFIICSHILWVICQGNYETLMLWVIPPSLPLTHQLNHL
jgi:hypothetical protein